MGRAGLVGMSGRAASAGAGAVASGVVDLLVTQAQIAARKIAPSVADDAARAVWGDVVDTLREIGLVGPDGAVWLHCSKTGRKVGQVQPDYWLDDLRAIARLGNTPSAEAALSRLVGGIVCQMAYAVAPVVAVSHVSALASLREFEPVGYLVQAVGDCFPVPARASSVDLALRAQGLARLRAGASALPFGVVQYACEVLALFLSHVQPRKVPGNVNPLLTYGAAGWFGAFDTIATASHFCGRVVQCIFALIARHRVKPMAALSRADLAALRVHYDGSSLYMAQKQARAILRADLASAENIRAYRMVTIDGKRRRRVMSGADIEAVRRAMGLSADVLNLDFSGLSDLADLQAASAALGRPVQVAVASRAELSALESKRDAAKAQAAALLDDGGAVFDAGASLDLGALLLAGALPDDFGDALEIGSESDLVRQGLVTLEEVLDFDFTMPGDDEEESDSLDDDSEGFSSDDLLADALAAAIAGAVPIKLG